MSNRIPPAIIPTTIDQLCPHSGGPTIKGKSILVAAILSLGAAIGVTVDPRPVLAANSVAVESRTVIAGQTACTVGVFLANDDSIMALGLALELRSVTGGAYFDGPTGSASSVFKMQPGRRLHASPLGVADPQGRWPAANTTRLIYETPHTESCSGPVSQTWRVSVASLTGTSPDGISFATISMGDELAGEQTTLPPGTDPLTRDSASLVFLFNANDSVGCIEIDTACLWPGNHTHFLLPSTVPVPVEFTLGTICTVPCTCDCHADPANCADNVHDVLDIHYVLNVALRGAADTPDPNPNCPTMTTDVDCDGATTILDVIKMIEVVFRGGDPVVEFCDPCA